MVKVNLKLLVTMIMLVASIEFHGAAAKDHIVGGPEGWNKLDYEFFYAAWVFNERSIYVNDVFVFNFKTGVHNVAEVSEAAYYNCDLSSPIQMYTSGPARVALSTHGIHYFVSTVGSDCKRFLKLGVRVDISADNSSAVLPH